MSQADPVRRLLLMMPTLAVRRALAAGVDVDARDARGRTAVTAAALGEHAFVAAPT